MAKAKTAKAPKAKKKSAKAAPKSAPKASSKKTGKSKAKDAADALWKLADHPLVGELLAVGATAAVAAIAEAGIDRGKKKVASKSVKEAGKAAAAAIGARLISEFAGEPRAGGKKAGKPIKAAKPAKA